MKKIAYAITILFFYFNNFLLISEQIELGIESITKVEEEYIIAIYAINPFDEIAGVQFEILPKDLFVIEEVYGGRCEQSDFAIHFNKNGIILGFSMIGNTIDVTNIVSGPNREKENIILYIKASANKISEYKQDTFFDLKYVIASKKGENLSTSFTPFPISKIN